MARITRHTGSASGSRLLSLPIVAAAFFGCHLLAVEARAHVRVPNYSYLDRKMESGDQRASSATRLERPGANDQGSAKHSPVCDTWRGANHFSVGASLAASLTGAPSLLLSELRLNSLRANSADYQEVLSFLDGFNGISAIVQVAERVTAAGVMCPLYVSVGGGEQIFWRFAPDDEFAGWFDESGRRLGEAALAQPKPGSRISSPFGRRRYYGRISGGSFHDGIDYEGRVGEPIFAVADGVIDHQGGYFEYGLTMKIRHAAQYTTLYAHMSRFANGLAVGNRVRKGELIGYVGMTGRSTGAHLHFSTIVNAKFVDPAPYLSENGDRSLSAPALATFRKWQHDIRAAVKGTRDHQRRDRIDGLKWTTRT
jgi:murein DD-endopeptidase MepM/ murein hydrolase activator NlpD